MKKILTLVFVLVLAVAFTGCGPEIADENGPEDTSLATITEENIINLDLGASGYSMTPSSESDDYLAEVTKFKGKEFSGVAEIYGTNLLGKSDFTVDLVNIGVNSGNFSVVVLLDDKIVHEFDNDEMMQTFRLDDVNGYVSVRLAGETADFKCWLQIW